MNRPNLLSDEVIVHCAVRHAKGECYKVMAYELKVKPSYIRCRLKAQGIKVRKHSALDMRELFQQHAAWGGSTAGFYKSKNLTQNQWYYMVRKGYKK